MENNVIRLRPILSAYEAMSPEELLKVFLAWSEEPGVEEIYTQDWLNRGLDLLPALYSVTLVQSTRDLLKDWYRLCLEIERAQGDDAS